MDLKMDLLKGYASAVSPVSIGSFFNRMAADGGELPKGRGRPKGYKAARKSRIKAAKAARRKNRR